MVCFVFLIFSLIILAFKIVYNWVLFKKLKREGWESLIPIYNTIIKMQVLDIPLWMIILLFIPPINIVVHICIAINMGKKFDKDLGFIIGLVFVPIIFYPILAFGKSEFHEEINGIFENVSKDTNYCTSCGTKVSGTYCTNCGKKI